MGRRNRKSRAKKGKSNKPRSGKKSSSGPDEFFQYGPIRMARYGTVNILENLSSASEQQEIIDRMAGEYNNVCAQIDTKVKTCRSIVVASDPIMLMMYCYWSS